MPPLAVTVAVPFAALLHKGFTPMADALIGGGLLRVTLVVVENLCVSVTVTV